MAGAEPPDCSVLVPVLNEGAHLEPALSSMRRQRFRGTVEFLVLDGGSTDGTREALAGLAATDPRVRLLENPSGSTPTALNIGLAHARGRWVARMDAHSEYPEDYLQLGVERLAQGDTMWASGPMIPTGFNPVSRATELALRSRLGSGATRKWAAGAAGAPAEHELDSGVFCGVWERQTLLELGGWDERWLRNQDSEMAGRVLARGEKLVCVAAMGARYAPRGSLSALWRQYRQYGEYRERTAVRHPHTLRRSHLLAPAVVAAGAGAVAAPAGVRRVARAGLAAYATALLAAGAAAMRQAPSRRDGALVPLVLGAMHLGHGTGFWHRVLRHGVPTAALAAAAGIPAGARAPTPPDELVYAPALAQALNHR